MSLALTLNNALSGLNVNRQSLAVLSQNIANSNTAGYTRKIINQENIYLDGNGSGVSIQDVSRKVDDYLIRSIRSQNAEVGKGNVISDYADRIQILLGKPGNQNSIDANIGNFFNSLQSLAQTPENSSLRVNAVNLGKTLANNINNLSNGLNDLRFQADQDIKYITDAVNQDISEIDKLNKTINTEVALGKSVGELLDKRDILVKDLSQYIDIQTYGKNNSELNINASNGISLLDENIYQLSYNPAGAVDSFINNSSISALQVYRLDANGKPIGVPKELVSGGTSDNIISGIASGKLAGLLAMRDKQLPDIIAQLDNVTAVLRDSVNAIHNTGSGYPGASALTGTHIMSAEDYSKWSGQVQIAILGVDGKPVAGSYTDETVTRPLTLDLANMNTGTGVGQPSVQGIIDEINRNFGAAQDKIELGNLNNINLVSNNKVIPDAPPQFNFDFNMENISATTSNVFITGVQIVDSSNVALSGTTSTLPTVALAGTYTTTNGSNILTINTTGTNNLKNGDKIYLSPPTGSINGIPNNEFDSLFTVSNVQAGSFDITTNSFATSTGGATVAGQIATPQYTQILAGTSARTGSSGTITADLSGNPVSPYYTVNVTVAVDDNKGNLSSSVISYRVNNNDINILNNRYAVTAATGNGIIVHPSSLQPVAKAMLVDENGVELAKINGVYTANKQGYLKIIAGNNSNYIAIDSKDSVELGKPNDIPATAATNRNFSHFFGLNNFFVDDGNARIIKTTGSAEALKVEQRLSDNPNLISLGTLVSSPLPNDINKPSTYSVERTIGDNSIIQKLAKLGIDAVHFNAVGGLGQTSLKFTAYAGQIIGAASSNANAATSLKSNAQTLLDGYNTRSDSISGVNLDEELANTIIYQNSYSASARIITVVSSLFDTLIQAVGR